MSNATTKTRSDADIALYERERARWEKARAKQALEIRPEFRMMMPIAFGAGKRKHGCALSGGSDPQPCTDTLVLVAGYRICTMHAGLVSDVVERAARGVLPRRPEKPVVEQKPRRKKARKPGCNTGGSVLQRARLDADAARCRRRVAR